MAEAITAFCAFSPYRNTTIWKLKLQKPEWLSPKDPKLIRDNRFHNVVPNIKAKEGRAEY